MAVPPDFVAGQVLTAAQMNKVGLWLIKTQTIGTTVSSVVVSDVFSADYENYKIIVSGGTSSSTNTNLNLTLGSTTTGYYYGGYTSSFVSSSGSPFFGNNAASFPFGTASLQNTCDGTLIRPFATDETIIYGEYSNINTSGNGGWIKGFVNNTTSYTAFTLTPGTGTLTGGTIYVYGYRD